MYYFPCSVSWFGQAETVGDGLCRLECVFKGLGRTKAELGYRAGFITDLELFFLERPWGDMQLVAVLVEIVRLLAWPGSDLYTATLGLDELLAEQ